MSWLEKLLPPKILHTDPADRRSVPEGLWIKCPKCESVLYKNDLEQNQNVCVCKGFHARGINNICHQFNLLLWIMLERLLVLKPLTLQAPTLHQIPLHQ